MISTPASADPLAAVRQKLRSYAERGVFQGFSEKGTTSNQTAFRFHWLAGRPMEITLDAARGELRFKHLLPGVPARSNMYRELKSFIAARHDAELPTHRRVDPARATAAFINRAGRVSLLLTVKEDQYEYATGRLVNLVHE